MKRLIYRALLEICRMLGGLPWVSLQWRTYWLVKMFACEERMS